jgi:DNA (cytosine-5)-methyltransferase 1
MAALLGHPMPQFPEPLYSFPAKDALAFKFPHGLTVRPINTEQGVAPFRHLTVDDAIGDLARFDW